MRYSEVEFNELLDALADDLLNAGHHIIFFPRFLIIHVS